MKWLARLLAIVLIVAVRDPASAAGFQFMSIPDDGGRPIELGIWYPSNAGMVPTTLGNVAQTVAVDGNIEGRHLPVVILSHGSAGWFGDRSDTALALAEAGFVAVALTHPGDNYKDSGDKIVQILLNRPRQISDVLDYVTRDWPGHARLDEARIGFYGFSAGGFTGLVASGGTPDWRLFPIHCAAFPAEGVCRQGSAAVLSLPQVASRPAADWHHDNRIKAAALASPSWAFAFDPASLGRIEIPVALWGGSEDHVIPFDSNVGYLRRHLAHVATVHDVEGAGHYSFLRPCGETARRQNPEICSDRPGFDRAAFQATFNRELVSFFQAALTATP